MFNAGKTVILAMLLVAVAMAGFSLWYHRATMQQVLRIYGPETSKAIALAPQVELWWLAPTADASPAAAELSDLDPPLAIVRRQPLAPEDGLAYARQSLLEDHNYRWEPAEPCAVNWTHGLRFITSDGATTLLFDLDCGQALVVEQQQTLLLSDFFLAALEKFLAAQEPKESDAAARK